MTPDEYVKKFNTCVAKWNLIFAYKSAVEIKNWEEIDSTNFAAIRNYAEFCYLDVQRMIIGLYPDADYDWKALEKKLDGLDEFLTMMLKKLDERPT